MSRGLGKIEQGILLVLRHGEWAGKPGTAHTVRQLRFWVYALKEGYAVCTLAAGMKVEDGKVTGGHEDVQTAWLNPALEASVRRGLASLERKGLVKKHIVPYPAWQGMPPQIRWSLSDAEVKEYNDAVKARKKEWTQSDEYRQRKAQEAAERKQIAAIYNEAAAKVEALQATAD